MASVKQAADQMKMGRGGGLMGCTQGRWITGGGISLRITADIEEILKNLWAFAAVCNAVQAYCQNFSVSTQNVILI